MKHTLIAFSMLAAAAAANTPADWWNASWQQRQAITIEAGEAGAGIGGALEEVTALVRLHDANFNFFVASPDGRDLRFVTADGTVLPHAIERFDGLINEAFVWVKLPTVTPGEPTHVHLYYTSGDSSNATDPFDAFDEATVMFHHFGGSATAFQDATRSANHAETPGTTSDSGIIGSSLRVVDGPLSIPASETLDWSAGQPLTISGWVRPTVLQDNAVVFSKASGGSSLRLILNQGIPVLQVATAAGTTATAPGEPLAAATWAHLAFVSQDGGLELFVNGESYATLDAPLPEISAPTVLGGLAGAADGFNTFNGEIDALMVSNVARSADWLRFSAVNQGAFEASQRTLVLSGSESAAAGAGHNETLEHIMLFGDIAKNMMFDGWIAVGVCVLMIIFGWTVAVQKFVYLNSIQKGTEEFVKQWKHMSTDLTAIDPQCTESIRTFGGKISQEAADLMQKSPLFQIYSIGSEEIRHRMGQNCIKSTGLSGRSIQAIRAALDTGLVRAHQKLTNGLIFLTVSIAGGPYVGLLGTVVGVMITFALIAKTGEVEVNTIAPGIASALLATTAGLVVAIPALFMYSYLNGRIKEVVAEIKVFIDEFVAKMAEFYPPASEQLPMAKTPELPEPHPGTLSDHQPQVG